MHTPTKAINHLLRFFIFLLSLWVSNNAAAQSSLYKNYSVKDGLPSSEVYSVMQDSKGYMWFGTDHGASRFDGYSFKSFTPSDGLADPMVLECIEDYKGRIWFRSLSGRLSYYYHDSIFRLPVNDTIVKLLKGNYNTSLSVDTNDCMFIGAHVLSGLVKIDLKHNYHVSFIPLSNTISYIIDPGFGSFITGTTRSFNRPANDHFLALYKTSSILSDKLALVKSFHWQSNQGAHSSLHNQAVKIADNEMVFSVSNDFLVTSHDTICFHYMFNTDILRLCINKSGKVWIIPQDEGVFCYSNGKITKEAMFETLKSKRLTSICFDKEGGIWVTTLNNGVFYISTPEFKTWNMENGLPGNKIIFAARIPNGSFSITAEGSEIISMINKDSIIGYANPKLPVTSITSILFHSDKTVWIGSTLGVYILQNINSTKQLSCNRRENDYQMIENQDGTVWTNGFSSLDLLQRKGDSIERIKSIRFKSRIFSFCKSIDRHIWIASMGGLSNYDPTTDSMKNYSNLHTELKNGIDYLQESADGDLWMATRDTGIIMMHHSNLLHLTTTDGLLSNLCKCLCIDYRGNVWVGSKEGISHIIVNSDNAGVCHVDAIKKMNSDNLMEVNYITCDSNMVYVATNNGLTSFDMDKIETNKTPPPIYVTSVKVNNKTFYSSNNTINLHYDENYISINFLGIAYRNAGNIQYRYKMTGIDTGWIYTKYISVQYPKLEPGSYTFSVSAMNNDGVWSTSPATFSFIISPPFWATWWARTIMGLIIIALIYWRIKDVEKREKKKTEVNKQLATFELKELKAQLDPHFLFNSLNTLTHLVEKVPEQAPEFVEELSTFYRYTLLHRNSEFTELKSEMEQAERYLKLLRIRFGDQLKVTWRIDQQYKDHLVPTNSLQLLFENITKHNVITPDNPLSATIETNSTPALVIKNELRLKPVPPLSNGIGLNSINERYRLMAGKKINISQKNGYFFVELPLISPKEYESINY